MGGHTVQNVIVTNTADQPVPVHEQGTANVNVTNAAPLAVKQQPITGGGDSKYVNCPDTVSVEPEVASAIVIHMSESVFFAGLKKDGVYVASFQGPGHNANPNIVLALARPIAFDTLVCGAFDNPLGKDMQVSWVGNGP